MPQGHVGRERIRLRLAGLCIAATPATDRTPTRSRCPYRQRAERALSSGRGPSGTPTPLQAALWPAAVRAVRVRACLARVPPSCGFAAITAVPSARIAPCCANRAPVSQPVIWSGSGRASAPASDAAQEFARNANSIHGRVMPAPMVCSLLGDIKVALWRLREVTAHLPHGVAVSHLARPGAVGVVSQQSQSRQSWSRPLLEQRHDCRPVADDREDGTRDHAGQPIDGPDHRVGNLCERSNSE